MERKNEMKITIIYDNEVRGKDLIADWGFACLAEVYGKRILFDTGANGSILLGNMNKLNIDPKSIDDVVISHSHWDHTGGLASFLMKNEEVRLYVPASFSIPSNAAKEVISVKEPVTIAEHIFSTGEIKGIEQSLIVDTAKGLIVIVGCSHPGVKDILEAASKYGKVHALIGGLHGFNEFDVVRDLGMICATHCTQHIPEIRSHYPDIYVEGGAGRVIDI